MTPDPIGVVVRCLWMVWGMDVQPRYRIALSSHRSADALVRAAATRGWLRKVIAAYVVAHPRSIIEAEDPIGGVSAIPRSFPWVRT